MQVTAVLRPGSVKISRRSGEEMQDSLAFFGLKAQK